jgi:hypothetical protein
MKPSFRRLVVGALMAFALQAVHAASIAVDTAEVE